MKINLVGFWDHNNYTQLTLLEYRRFISADFNFEFYDAHKTYDKKTLFVCNAYQYNQHSMLIDNLITDGYKVVFETLQEMQTSSHHTQDNILHLICNKSKTPKSNTVEVPLYFWYHEHGLSNYQDIERSSTIDKKFLLMMNLSRTFRNDIYNKFTDILDQGLYSYVGQNILLDGDNFSANWWDRYINPSWYNRTEFSVVVESQMNTGGIFITEKTMKPLALKHPFILLGSLGTLEFMQSVGFVTYDNLFDETYDKSSDRLNLVYKQVKDYSMHGYDKLTTEKIEHNYNLFFNNVQLEQSFKQSIINPLLEFVNE